MNILRKSKDRGYADHGWLKSFHTFSFAGYHDPAHMGFSVLRVINEDRIIQGAGFGTHGHKDMEIISYVLDGALAHKDSMGNGSSIKPGDVQRLSAGTGMTHSEFNGNAVGDTHFFQIWILPIRNGGAPSYEEKHFSVEKKRGQFCLIASGDSRLGSVLIQQDVSIYAGLFSGAETAMLPLDRQRVSYVQMARGSAIVNGQSLLAGDALMISESTSVNVSDGMDAEVLVFDLPR
jgi:quercetin 2,3-dioxygenase